MQFKSTFIIAYSTRFIVALAFTFLVSPAFSQKKYSVQKGEIKFASKAQLELIQASSDKVQGLLDPATHLFAFNVDIKSFRGFNSELQREHFNEKYLESEKYPKAKFSGKIIEQVDFTANNTFEVRAKGDLEIHGVKQNRIIKSRIVIKDGTVTIESSFLVPLADHDIAIPNIVSQKIATEIEVEFKATMAQQ
jgi:polyisoprenoid-binding protein YceI